MDEVSTQPGGRQTDTCENISFSQLRWRAVIIEHYVRVLLYLNQKRKRIFSLIFVAPECEHLIEWTTEETSLSFSL